MTRLHQLITIVELNGWKRHFSRGEAGVLEWWKPDGSFAIVEDLPNYLGSRDNIIPVVSLLPEHSKRRFVIELQKVVRRDLMKEGRRVGYFDEIDNAFYTTIATAAQLSEAYLRCQDAWEGD